MKMKFYDFILESEGVTNRKAGDLYVDQHDNVYKFEMLLKEPEVKKLSPEDIDTGAGFHTIEDLDKDVANQIEMVMKKLSANEKTVHVNNKKTPKTKSYMMMVLINQKNQQPVFVIRYSDKPNEGVKWPSSDLKKMPEMQLTYAKGGSSKRDVLSGIIQVSNIFDNALMSSEDMIKKGQAAFTAEKKPIQKQILGSFVQLLKDIYMGGREKYVVKGMKKYENVFDVSLAEAVVPMALLEIAKGKNKGLFAGDSISSLEKCIGVKFEGFGNLKVLIPKKSNEKLIDSVVYNGSDKLFSISNKAGKGAAASMTNILDAVAKIEKDDKKQHKELLKKYPEELRILDIINNNKAIAGTLEVAKELGIINDVEVKQVWNVYKAKNLKGISKRLAKLISSVESNSNLSGYTVGDHLLTAIAKEVARLANTNPKYMELIKRVLMSAKFVQASVKFTSSGDDLVLSSIKLIWPPVVKSVKIDSNKNFSSTKIRGKLSFVVH